MWHVNHGFISLNKEAAFSDSIAADFLIFLNLKVQRFSLQSGKGDSCTERGFHAWTILDITPQVELLETHCIQFPGVHMGWPCSVCALLNRCVMLSDLAVIQSLVREGIDSGSPFLFPQQIFNTESTTYLFSTGDLLHAVVFTKLTGAREDLWIQWRYVYFRNIWGKAWNFMLWIFFVCN